MLFLVTSWFDRTRGRGVALAMLVALMATLGLGSQAFAQVAGDYRSAATGNWGTVATWQRFDGTAWVAAVATPTSTDGAITIRSPHVVTIAATVTYDQVTVDAGGQVTVAAAIASTLANGTGTDLIINGTWFNSGGVWSTTGTWSVGAGGTYIHNTTSGVSTPLNNATLDPASTFIYRGSSTLTPASSFASRTYGNLSFESTSGALTITSANTTPLGILGNLTVGSGVTYNSTGVSVITVSGNFTNSGTIPATFVSPFTFNGTTTVSGNAFAFGGGYTVNAGKSLALSGATFALVAGKTGQVNGTLQINQGAFPGSVGTFAYGAGGTLVYNNTSGAYGPVDGTHVYWPSVSGPTNVTVAGAGGIILSVSRTVSGTFQTAAAVVGASNLTLNGTCQINTGGSLASAPTYGGASTLRYNTGGTYGRSNEWVAIPATEPANVQLSNSTTLNYPNGGGAFAHTITGNLTIDTGSSLFMDFGSPGTGVGALTVGGNVALNGSLSLGNTIGGDLRVGGNFTRTGTLFPNNRAVEFTGSTNRSITGATTFDFLTISNTGGVSLNNDVTVNQTLALGNNRITTGGSKVALASTGSLTRGTGYVFGNLQKNVATGSSIARTFEIGDATHYTPASLTFASVTAAGDIVGSTTVPGTLPAPANLSTSKFVNRNWTLTNSGVGFTNYDATLNFEAADIQGAGDPNNFIVAKNTGGSYTQPVVGTRTATSTQATGMTSLSDFYVGEIATFTITASAGAHGSISPSGAVVVNAGANQGFTVTAAPGYHIADVLMDGVSAGTGSSHTFTAVSANHTIAASFAIDTYTITASAGANGSIAPSGVTVVNSGGGQTYTITPNAGYVVQDVLVDAVSVGAVTSYSFTNVTSNRTISASFAPDPNSVVGASASGTYVSTVNPSVPVAITLTRGVTTPMLGFSVTFTLSGLTTTTGAITQGGFLAASGASTNFQVTDNGGGSYTVDGVTLGLPCGSGATSGTLFTVGAGSSSLSGPGTLTITSVALRDCSNAPLSSSVGTAASVNVDRSTPAVAVTSPNGGESWLQGSVQAITWTATDTEGIAANSIVLEYSANGGSSWLPVASGLSNSGTYNWTVPNTPTLTALVRASATDVHANVGSDASDAAFMIQGTTTTSLTSAPNPSVSGESVTLTATVAPAAATGSVEFFDGVTSLGLGSLSGGTASLNTATLTVGAHSLTAVYAGSTLYTGSTSATHAHTVNPAATTTSLTSAPNPSLVGESVALTATVGATAPGAGTPGGSVQFFDGATSLGTATLSAGSAVLNTTAIAVGARSLTAVYAGSTNFSTSTSAVHSHTVDPAATTTAASSTPNPTVFGQSTTISATVAAVAPGAGTATGSVQFFEGATSLGTATLSGGSASISTSALSVGSHDITAVYAGSGSFTGSTSAIQAHVVNPASTTTTASSTPNPTVFGQSTTISATVAAVAPGAGTATGSVQFFDGATSLGTAALSGGSASISTSALSVGSHDITAVYAGSGSFTGSMSAIQAHVVNPASTTTTASSTPNPSSFGQSVSISATVAAVAPGAGTATGSVQFFDGLTSLGTATLSGGSASISTSALSVGSHDITAVYAGSPSFTGSTSAIHAHTVSAAASATSLTSSPNPSVVGESVALNAAVAPASATGTVEFFDGATSLGTAAVSGGSASTSTSSLSVGAHSLTAVYSGDGSYSGSTSAVHSHTVDPAATTTTVSSTPNPTVFGQSTTISATVAAVAPGAGGPEGSVQFFDGLTSLGTAALSGGSASISTSALIVGSHDITAVYAGSPSFTGSTSAIHAHTVGQAATTTTASSTPNPTVFGQSTTISATVAAVAPGAGGPEGSVQFFDGLTSLGTAALSGGSASISTSALIVGSHDITAVYAGSGSFTGSTSAIQAHVVNQAATATSLTSAPNPTLFGQSTTLTATVAVVAPGAGGPEGSVQFFDGLTPLGSSALSAGTATLNTSTLSVGSHSLTAVYSGDPSFGGSTSAVHTHDVNNAATTTVLASAPNPSVAGASVALTATVAPAAASGSVTFFDGATLLGSSALAAGTATFNTSALAVGLHSLTAVYGGDATYTASTSAPHSHTVNQASTTTSVTSTPNPSVFGESVSIGVSVTVDPPGAGTATGSVELFDGATSLGTQPLLGGSASFASSSLGVGAHSLTAVYAGSPSFAGSTSAVHLHTVDPAATATSLTSAPNPTLFGQSTTLTASVSVTAPGAGSPGGSVTFFEGVTSLGTSPLIAGSATLAISTLGVGPHSLTAVYSGNPSFSGSTSAAYTHNVSQAASSTTVVSSLNPSTFGASVTFTASVAPSGATGSVQFLDGVTLLGSSAVSAGTAAFAISTLSAGSHPITAVYSGDLSFSGSTSAVLTQVVNAAATSVSLVAAPNPGVYLDNETLTATVAPAAATGTVEFFDGVTSLGPSPVVAGVATLNTSSLSVGVHSLTAVYSGDLDHAPATSPAVSLEIQAKIVATAGPNGSITPSGTVLVSLGATPAFAFAADAGYHVSSVTVDGGAAALTSPYTFAAVSSNHTIDVQFAVNPAVAAISTLAGTQLRSGNDGDGTTKITLSWTPVPAGSSVEVWRKGFGNYPEYDDGPTPGGVPSTPPAYPPAGWTLTSVTTPGGTDEPTSRDFWYYVAFVRDSYGTVSSVSNQTTGALNYHLGDVSDGVTLGAGNNQVATDDISLLGAHYGITGVAVDAFAYLDVGPTTTSSVLGRPATDNRVNFEDLVMFAINYFPVASAPQAHARPAAATSDALTLNAPVHAAVGEDIVVRVDFTGTGQVLALSARLSWDPAVVEPVSYTAGDAVLAQQGVVFSAEPGMVDGASLAGTGLGLVGEGEFATVHFRVVAAGEPKFGFARVDARDSQNRPLHVNSGVLAVAPRAFVTAFAPAMPNPFGRTTMFAFSLAKAGRAELEVFSVDGRRVRTLSTGVREAGEYRVEWNGADDSGRSLAAGVYYARLVTPQGRFTRVVTYLR